MTFRIVIAHRLFFRIRHFIIVVFLFTAILCYHNRCNISCLHYIVCESLFITLSNIVIITSRLLNK